jgi:hypothetical protein
MGLDMYLRGEKYYRTNWSEPNKNITEDGFKLVEKHLEIGYWRKHPNLHGYIVETFANGVDECQKIELSVDDLLKILRAVKEKGLPNTTGFFFGKSDGSEDKETIKILESAVEWVKQDEPEVSRTVYYKASW